MKFRELAPETSHYLKYCFYISFFHMLYEDFELQANQTLQYDDMFCFLQSLL